MYAALMSAKNSRELVCEMANDLIQSKTLKTAFGTPEHKTFVVVDGFYIHIYNDWLKQNQLKLICFLDHYEDIMYVYQRGM